MAESCDDAHGQEATRVRRVWRGIRAQAVVDCAHQVSYCGIEYKKLSYQQKQDLNRDSGFSLIPLVKYDCKSFITLGLNLGVATKARRSTVQSAASSSWMSPTSSGTSGGTKRSGLLGRINNIGSQARNKTHRLQNILHTAEIVLFYFC